MAPDLGIVTVIIGVTAVHGSNSVAGIIRKSPLQLWQPSLRENIRAYMDTTSVAHSRYRSSNNIHS